MSKGQNGIKFFGFLVKSAQKVSTFYTVRGIEKRLYIFFFFWGEKRDFNSFNFEFKMFSFSGIPINNTV